MLAIVLPATCSTHTHTPEMFLVAIVFSLGEREKSSPYSLAAREEAHGRVDCLFVSSGWPTGGWPWKMSDLPIGPSCGLIVVGHCARALE